MASAPSLLYRVSPLPELAAKRLLHNDERMRRAQAAFTAKYERQPSRTRLRMMKYVTSDGVDITERQLCEWIEAPVPIACRGTLVARAASALSREMWMDWPTGADLCDGPEGAHHGLYNGTHDLLAVCLYNKGNPVLAQCFVAPGAYMEALQAAIQVAREAGHDAVCMQVIDTDRAALRAFEAAHVPCWYTEESHATVCHVSLRGFGDAMQWDTRVTVAVGGHAGWCTEASIVQFTAAHQFHDGVRDAQFLLLAFRRPYTYLAPATEDDTYFSMSVNGASHAPCNCTPPGLCTSRCAAGASRRLNKIGHGGGKVVVTRTAVSPGRAVTALHGIVVPRCVRYDCAGHERMYSEDGGASAYVHSVGGALSSFLSRFPYRISELGCPAMQLELADCD